MNTKEEYYNWKTDSPDSFESFGAGLLEYTKTGQIPARGDMNVRHALEVQKSRLKEKGLIMKYEISPRGHFANTSGPPREWKDDHYTSHMEYRSCRLTRKIFRDGKKVFDKGEDCIFYQTITDANNETVVASDYYPCPNCGAPSQIKELENGCPYCRTFFKMQDLFPKTTNFYFLRDIGGTEKEMKRVMLKYMIPCMPVIFLVNIFRMLFVDGMPEYLILELVGLVIGSVIGGCVLGYLICTFHLMIQTFIEAGKSMPMLFNTAGSGKRFVTKMKRYSPEFSFEYFSGKVVALLKMILFSEKPSELTCYTGKPLEDRFANIIDSSYAGACALKRFKIQGDYCYVTVEVYMEDFYHNGNRIYQKDEKFRVTLCKNIRKPINLHFSIKAMQCAGCGSSFDATKQKCCPSCGTQHTLADEDWVVTEIQRR